MCSSSAGPWMCNRIFLLCMISVIVSAEETLLEYNVTADPFPCTFAHELAANESTRNLSVAIDKKCRTDNHAEGESFKTTVVGNTKSVKVTTQLCGVRAAKENIASIEQIYSLDICLSVALQGAKTLMPHKIRISNLVFNHELQDIRRAKFINKKRGIEDELNEAFFTDSTMNSFGYAGLIITSFEKGAPPPAVPEGKRRKKRATSDEDTGTEITAFVQLMMVPEPDETDYTNAVTNAIQAYSFKNTINESLSSVGTPQKCGQLTRIKHFIPPDIYAATEKYIDPNATELAVGEAAHFVCPPNKKLSHDDDDFIENDDLYSVQCTVDAEFKVPELLKWPSCVRSCGQDLQAAPEHTGLAPVIPLNTIAAGQHAQYVCKDTSLGIERGPSEYWNIECLKQGEYAYPSKEENWPSCRTRTTTVSPVVWMALDVVMQRNRKKLESQFKVFRWEEGDEGYVEPKSKPWFWTITCPAVAGILAFVFLVCLCARDSSPCCQICTDEFRMKKKFIKPIFKKGEKQSRGRRPTYNSLQALHDATRERPNIYKNNIG